MRSCARLGTLIALTLSWVAITDVVPSVHAAGSPDVLVQPPCDDNAFEQAMDLIHERGGGSIGFNCGNASIVFKTVKTIDLDIQIFGAGEITINGTNSTPLFIVEGGKTFTLSDISLINAFGPEGGSAVTNYGTLIVRNAVFRNNNTPGLWAGGAVSNLGGAMSIENTLFESNTAADGGAIYSRSTMMLDCVTFATNVARQGHGGAIFTLGQPISSITDSLFVNNFSQAQLGRGGAIYANGEEGSPSTLNLWNTGFLGNSAYYGGAVFVNAFSKVKAVQTLFKANRARGYGGAIENVGNATIDGASFIGNSAALGSAVSNRGTMTVQNATLSDNTFTATAVFLNSDDGTATLTHVTFAGNHDGSDLQDGATVVQYSTQTIALRNVVLERPNTGFSWGNCDRNGVSALYMSQGFNVSNDNSCASAFTQAGDRNDTNPKLGPLADNGSELPSHLPLSGSPLIDRGQCVNGIGTDQRGVPRPQGDSCDIGAVEWRSQDAPHVYLPMAVR